MMIVYDRFWEMLKKRGITQYALVHQYKISASSLQRIRKNGNLWMSTIEKLCDALNCGIEDMMEFKPDE